MTTWLNAPFEMRFCVISGLTVRFARSGDRDRRHHVLLLSPWSESLLAFEPIWSQLAEHAHLVAIDLPGFGRSQRDAALLSPRAMGEFIVSAVDAFGLDHPHVIGPDIGTAASLFAAALYPGRLRSLVVGSGGAAVPLRLGGILKQYAEATDLGQFRADSQPFVTAALAGMTQYVLPDSVRADYLFCYQGDRFAESMRYLRSYPRELPILHDLLPGILTPVQIIAGSRDAAVPPANARLLHQRLPRSELHIIDAGHFPWEDAADQYAALLTGWLRGGHDIKRLTDPLSWRHPTAVPTRQARAGDRRAWL